MNIWKGTKKRTNRNFNSSKYKEVKIKKHSKTFPHDEIGAQLIGYTNADNKGISGLEKYFEHQLEGELDGFIKPKE